MHLLCCIFIFWHFFLITNVSVNIFIRQLDGARLLFYPKSLDWIQLPDVGLFKPEDLTPVE